MSAPLLSILIPFRDHVELLNQCLASLPDALADRLRDTEVILIDNGSTETSLAALQIPAVLTTRTLRFDIPFNFQRLNNLAAAQARGRFVLLLNNDIVFTPKSRGFVDAMTAVVGRKDVGAVGPLLWYPDGTIQHAGVVVGMNTYADHLYRGYTPALADAFPFSRYRDDRKVSAVTAAFLMVEKRKYDEVSGMDERFIVCGGDVDLCLRLVDAGYQNIYMGSVEAIHLESKSRASQAIPPTDFTESERSYNRYLSKFGGRDPFYPAPLPLSHSAPKLDDLQVGSRFARTKQKARWTVGKLRYIGERLTYEPVESVVAHYTTRMRERLRIGSALPVDVRIPKHELPVRWHREFVLGRKPRLNLLLPSLDPKGLFGGITTAVLVATKFKRRHPQIDVRFVLVDGPGDEATLQKVMQPYFETPIVSGEVTLLEAYDRKAHSIPVREGDVFLATAWWTCHSATALTQAGERFLYLVQDFEPGFYPWGEAYAHSLATYGLNFVPLFNSSWLADYFRHNKLIASEQLEHGASFEPAVNPRFVGVRAARRQPLKKRKLFFYGRPSVARNLFNTGVNGLRQAIAANVFQPDAWEFVSAGEAHGDIALGHGCVLRSMGKMSIEAYETLLSEIDIGLSLMLSPHPSYPPLEVASAGAYCVTNRFANKDLSEAYENIVSCDATRDSVASALAHAVARADRDGFVSRKPARGVAESWDTSLEKVLGVIASQFIETAPPASPVMRSKTRR